MEFLAKRALFIASKRCGQIHYSNGIRLSRACFYNTAYERSSDQGLRKERSEETRDNERATRYDHNNVENMSGVTADTAVQGAKVAESLGEVAKETMDKAWDSARNATRDVQEMVVATADENVVDTAEYRTIIDLKNSIEADNIQDRHRERSEI